MANGIAEVTSRHGVGKVVVSMGEREGMGDTPEGIVEVDWVP
jgi:hypothetical protein